MEGFRELFIAACLGGMLSFASAQPDWAYNAVKQSSALTVPKEASAIIMHKLTEVEISSKSLTKIYSQIAVKILTSAGSSFGVMSIPVSPFVEVKKLKGWIIKHDGSAKALPADNIVTISPQESAGYYDDSHIVVAALPGVEPGVIVAFEIALEEKGWTSLFNSFTFQIQEPVKFAQYAVTIPQGWDLLKGEWRTGPVQFEQQGNRYLWTARDLAYQPEEPLAPSWDFLSRRVSVNCFDPSKKGAHHFSQWPEVAQWANDLHRQAAAADQQLIRETRSRTDSLATLQEKLRAIAAFSQKEIRYVAVEIGKERWQPRPAPATFFNRYGDCKDKTTLMRAMLEAIGINAVPVLVNTEYPVDPDLPTPFQFNHCIVGIRVPQDSLPERWQHARIGDWLLFDPTDEVAEIGELPWPLMGRMVLIAANADTVLLQLPYADPEDFRRVYHTRARLNDDGSFSADVDIIDYGSLATYSRYSQRINPGSKQVEEWRSEMAQKLPGIQLEGFRTAASEDSVTTSFSIKGQRFIQKAGNLVLLRPNLFYSPEPPRLTAEERQHPIWFGPPIEINSEVLWQLPEDWTPEIDLSEFESGCSGALLRSQISFSGSLLHYRFLERQTGRLMWPDEYPGARNYDKDLSAIKGQTLLLKTP